MYSSEPVQLPAQNKFELDGKTYFGKVAQPSRTIILTPFNTAALSVGAHKLVVSGINDYANFVSLTSTHDFTVVEDKEAPTITESSATLETVTLTFSEEVDADTIKASNVYWKSGDSKKTAKSFEVIEDNKVKFTFDRTNALPTGAVTVYVDGVKDYSGNQIASGTSVVVNAVIDQTRPEVKKATVVDSKTIKVVFSKSLLESSAENKANYTVVNKDNKVLAVKSADLGGTNNNEVTIELYSALSAGDNTLTIKNVKDNTRLENTMLDYSGTINAADTEVPKIDSVLVKTSENVVILGFSKKMDPATLQDLTNYNYSIGN
ncbi:Ig-like domain-containing protein [Paenibacillus sp. JTLBN-2024]